VKKEPTIFEFYCYLWFAAKYARPNRLLGEILSKKEYGNKIHF